MAQQTVTEKDSFLQSFQKECQTTLKVLKAYPAAQAGLRPHPRAKSANELAYIFTLEQGLSDMALKGKIELGLSGKQAPADLAQTIAAFESAMKDTIAKVTQAGDDVLNRTVQFPTGPGKMGDFRAIDVLWITLRDQIHHRGQFSVYLRMSGAKVPSIYGPSADEPWM